MRTQVYMISMNGADKSWLIVREETWYRLQGAPVQPVVLEDLKAWIDPSDFNEFSEVLNDFTLSRNDLAKHLPPMYHNGEIAEFFSLVKLGEFIDHHGMAIINEFTCYT